MDLREFRNFLNSDKIYKPEDILDVIHQVRKHFRFSYSKKVKYFNVPASFDIETSSFFRTTGKSDEQEKVAIMYEWTFGLYGLVIIGRTWQQFITMFNALVAELNLDENKRLCVYVHILGYEFQFIRKWLEWSKVFSIETRRPIYALTTVGVEFRCSYLLSGYSLEKLGEGLRTYTVRKLVGSLDYDKIRHSETVLSDAELAYCVNDVKVVMAYIAERIEQDGEISRIPLTKTGYVRNYCRNSCFYENVSRGEKSYKYVRYRDIMKGLRLSPEEYNQLKDAFQGGFTHANPFIVQKVIPDVTSFDFTSSYPAVMCAEKFPMSSSEKIVITSKDEFEKNIKLYCCLFDVEFTDLESILWQDNYISESRCREIKNPTVNNGRIVRADFLRTTITEQDYFIIRKFYSWKTIKIGNFRRYKKGYLPTDFVKAILKLYRDKTALKGVEGKEIEYVRSKEMINSCYGMTVTDIVRDEIVYALDEWQEPLKAVLDTTIAKYNNNRGRFLFYPWGVWVTAYARRNLFSGIIEFGNDYIYSDTDSIKARNADKHMTYIEEYNMRIREQLYKAMEYHNINKDEIEPETKDGIKKCLGVWDFDGHYSRFKTLGAKRYMVEYSDDIRNKAKDVGKINITVAGLNKQLCVPWMRDKWGKDGMFEHFDTELYVPAEYTGKKTHTYIDEMREGDVIDYTGKVGHYRELSAVHLENSDYSLSIAREFAEYLRDIKKETY